MSATEKRCTKCGETRPLEEFQRDRSRRDGRRSHCAHCCRAAARERRRRYAARATEAVPAEKRCPACERTLPAAAFSRDRGSADGLQSTCRDCASEYMRDWYEKNADRERERKRAWRESNADRYREYQRNWRESNADRVREQQREYWRSPAGRAVARARDARRRAAKRNRACACTSSIAVEVLLALGGCLYCGSTEDVTLDHVVALAAGGWDCLDNLAPACRRCNLSKNDRPVEYLAGRLAERGVEPLVETTEAAIAAVPMPCWVDYISEPEVAA